MCVCICILVTQSRPTLCDHMHYRQPDSSIHGIDIHGILRARILEWEAISFFRGSSRTRDWIQVSCIAGRFFTIWATFWNLYYSFIFPQTSGWLNQHIPSFLAWTCLHYGYVCITPTAYDAFLYLIMILSFSLTFFSLWYKRVFGQNPFSLHSCFLTQLNSNNTSYISITENPLI